MLYKVTFSAQEQEIARLKEKGAYPIIIGGIYWEKGSAEIVESLLPFISDKRELAANSALTNEQILEFGLIDSRLSVELTEETHAASQGEI